MAAPAPLLRLAFCLDEREPGIWRGAANCVFDTALSGCVGRYELIEARHGKTLLEVNRSGARTVNVERRRVRKRHC